MKNETFGLPVGTVTLAPPDQLRRLEEWRRLAWPPGDVERQKDFLLGPPTYVTRRVVSLEDFDVYSRTALSLIREIVRESRAREDTALLEFCRSWYIVTASFTSPFTSVTAHMPLRRAALVDFGDDPDVLLLVGSYGRPPAVAEATLRRVLALDPLRVEARVRLGRLLYRTGRQDEAGLELERAVRDARDAQNVAMEYLGRLFLGRLHEDTGRTEEAATCYEAAAALDPSWQAAHVALGRLRVAVGETDEGWASGQGDDLTSTFVSVLRDFRARYVLTYEPAGVRRDDGWHELRVGLNGRKGTTRARHGYYATSTKVSRW